jgi:hypothetical protein
VPVVKLHSFLPDVVLVIFGDVKDRLYHLRDDIQSIDGQDPDFVTIVNCHAGV